MKIKFIIVFLFFLFVKINSKFYDCEKLKSLISTSLDYQIPEGDDIGDYGDVELISLQIDDFNSFAEINITCSAYLDSINGIFIIPRKNLILDSSFNLNGLHLHSVPAGFYISKLKGINLNLNLINSFKNVFDLD